MKLECFNATDKRKNKKNLCGAEVITLWQPTSLPGFKMELFKQKTKVQGVLLL